MTTGLEPEKWAEAILNRWAESLRAAGLVRPEWVEEVIAEARPTVHSLLFASSLDTEGSPRDLQRHEAMAMATLFGRRVASLGMTPSVMMTLVPGLMGALEAEGVDVDRALVRELSSVCVEGFVRGREESVTAEGDARVAQTFTTLEPAPGVFALVLAGDPSPESIEEALESFARALFGAEAKVCMLEVSGLSVGSPRLARALFSIDETARMIGVRCLFSGASEQSRVEAQGAGLDLDALEFHQNFGDALRFALECMRAEGRRGRFFGRRLEDFLRLR